MAGTDRSGQSEHRHAVIIAGGSGTRLWPISRPGRPKQLVPMANGRSLLDLAIERAGAFVADRRDHVWLCTTRDIADAINDQASTLESPLAAERVICEPVGRDTVNAVLLSAFVVHHQDPDAIVVILTADHLIEPTGRFVELLDIGCEVIHEHPSRIVTFSIKPAYAETAYGYIERGPSVPWRGKSSPNSGSAFEVARYVEKPDAAAAKRYIESGRFGWSSGMFAFRASTMLAAAQHFLPETHLALSDLMQDADRKQQWDEHLTRLYPTLKATSVDYAIMEPLSRCASPGAIVCPTLPDSGLPISLATVVMDMNWIDVGSWSSLKLTGQPDAAGNVSMGRTLLEECKNVLAYSEDEHHLIAAIGCDDLVIVHSPHATLVCPRSRAQEVKALAKKAAQSARDSEKG